MVLTLDENEQILDIRPDPEDTQTLGYACPKGLQAVEAHYGPGRIRRPLKKLPDGSFEEVPLEQALDEIALRLGSIL